jgi:prepilin-type N-terminal cleavage/methylation domain-containing protein
LRGTKANHRCRGFTLIEVLLAISLSAGLLVGVLSFYQQVSTVRAKLDERVAVLSAVRLLMQHLTFELQAIPAQLGDAPLVGTSDFIEFTTATAVPRSAWNAGSLEHQSSFRPETDRKRVSYRLRGPWRPHRAMRRPAGTEMQKPPEGEEARRRREEQERYQREAAWFYGVEWKEQRFPHRLLTAGGRAGRNQRRPSAEGRSQGRFGEPLGSRLDRDRRGNPRESVRPGMGVDSRDGGDPRRPSRPGEAALDRRRGRRPAEELSGSRDRPAGRSLRAEMAAARQRQDQSPFDGAAGAVAGTQGVVNPTTDWHFHRGIRITDRIRFLRFRYYDGSGWRDDWRESELPVGIEIQFGEKPLPAELFPAEYPFTLFRRIVHLPTAGALGLPALEMDGGFDNAL